MKKYEIKILIISRGRADTITTHKVLPDWVEILVPESEESDYRQKVSNPILTIPDDVKGLGEVRNWVLKHFDEETVIMIDDDIKCLYRLTGKLTQRVTDKEEIVQVLINTAVMAKDMGVHCFGFAQTDIRKFDGTDPFKLCTWVGGVIGVIGRKYDFRKDKFKVDIDFCLQNLLVDRIIFQDSRYTFPQSRDNNVGGNSMFRTEDDFKKSVDSLKEKWGDNIKVRDFKNQIKISLSVGRRQKIEL